MTKHRTRIRGRSVYVVIVLAGLFVATVMSFALGVDHRSLEFFNHVDRPAYQVTTDPITAAITGRLPQDLAPELVPSPDVRAIIVRPVGISLVAAGKRVRFIKGPATSLADVARKVADPSWVRQTPDSAQLYSALVLDHVPAFTINTPIVDLVNEPGVFIGAKGSTLTIASATVRAVTRLGFPAPAGRFRPFVLADQGSRMDVTGSTFDGLGYDWSGSYGVAWLDDSTGGSTNSRYRGNFIGVYTDHARDLSFAGDEYTGNALYGMDPHSGSHGLRISGCTAAGNGAHGIIFSEDVTASSVSGCTSQGNGENGIMMDARSTGNTLIGNHVQANHGDGIVLSDSPTNVVTGNFVGSNRVGVQVSPSSVDGTRVESNDVTDNISAAQGVDLESANASYLNGSQWRPLRVVLVVATVALLSAVWMAGTVRLRRRRGSARLAAAFSG